MTLETDALEIINRALLTAPKVKALWALYSGGHDSLVAAHVASRHPLFRGVIHVNTKTSPAAHLITLYARRMIGLMGWNSIEVSPFITFAQIVVKYGFPSPDSHEFVYQYLKGRPLAQARQIAKLMLVDELSGETPGNRSITYKPDREYQPLFVEETWAQASKVRKQLARTSDVAFVSGIRREESVKRSKKPEYALDHSVLWINPILHWKKTECSQYIDVQDLLRNRQADVSGISGECDCAAHAMAGEIDFKCSVNADMALYREKLEALARASRDLQLLEVKLGMRDAADIIDEHDTVWGHGRKNARLVVPPGQTSLFRICSDCDGERDQRVLEMMIGATHE